MDTHKSISSRSQPEDGGEDAAALASDGAQQHSWQS